ncbi:hypothetical protein NBRGN_010_00270 [Nocardia brasiliensis NBRC 14402]|nr:DUF3027 domain-containing protein [Nocardia brasiliensis]GAJ79387.1 hypothetical protein NBRGN_010_00270 [Nocardia brasiliensis NBRC 14402]SUB11313.1 Protein of uncharacterised function (DUF3027) [Nocardia brasiliensis]
MSAVSVSESGVRPILADAVDLARRALLELEPAGVGAHLGVAAEDESAATHRFEATLPGYRGWQWAVVVAAPPEAEYATVSESALLPGPDALVAPDFVPWDQRIRPGDLAPGDLLAPPPNDPRLVPGYVANGDPVVDEVALEVGLGRTQVMSLEGRADAAERWHAEYGPDTEMAKAAPSTCGLCGFYLPLAGSLRAAFGVCGNAMGADGRVVHAAYGCGAHSDTVAPTGGGSPLYEAFDDAAVELIPTADLRQSLADETPAAAPAQSAESAAGTDDSSAPAGDAANAHESADPTDGPTVEVAAVPPRAAAESAVTTTAPGETSNVDTAAGESGTALADATAAAAVGEGDPAEEATISDAAPGTPDTEPGAAPVANGEPTVEVPVASPRGDVEIAGTGVVSVGGSESPATQQAEVEAPPAAHEPTTSGAEAAAPSDTVAAQPTADVVAAVAADDTAASVASESARAYAESAGAEIVSAGAADSARTTEDTAASSDVSPEATQPLAPVGETQPLAAASAAAEAAAAESGAAASGAQQVGDEDRSADAGFEAQGSDAERRGDAAEGGADESSRQG